MFLVRCRNGVILLLWMAENQTLPLMNTDNTDHQDKPGRRFFRASAPPCLRGEDSVLGFQLRGWLRIVISTYQCYQCSSVVSVYGDPEYNFPMPIPFADYAARVHEHLEQDWGIPIIERDIPDPLTGDLNGAEIDIDYAVTAEQRLFLLGHLFGHTVQWNVNES